MLKSSKHYTQQHREHGACCDECHRVECHDYECKREKINPVCVPIIGDPLKCDRKTTGKYYKDGALVRTKEYGGKKLDNWSFWIVDHGNTTYNGFSPMLPDENIMEHYLESKIDAIEEQFEKRYKGQLEMQQETIDKLMEALNEQL